MSLLALEVGKGDEVIIPSLTFVADANVVSLVEPYLNWRANSLEDWNSPLELLRNRSQIELRQ